MSCVGREVTGVSVRESSRLAKEGASGNQIIDGNCSCSVNHGD